MNTPFEPALLVSMPQLQDPNFARAVVLLCDFAPEGAFGLVLNRPTDMTASSMVKLEPAVLGANGLPLCIGGPVEPQRGWILLAEPPEESRVPHDLRRRVPFDVAGAAARRADGIAAPRARVLAGYAGWGPGQLDEELAQSAWLIGSVEADLLFDVDSELMWETAIRRLGANPSALQMSHGVH